MSSFAAIDFETANQHHSAICSIGLVLMENGVVTKKFYSLVKPYPDYYESYLTNHIHGISDEDTHFSKNFAEVWPEIDEIIGERPIVAHNATFERSCLRAAYEHAGWKYPDYPLYCTVQLSRKLMPDLCNHRLPTVCSAIGFPIPHHHNALADALACAQIGNYLLQEHQASSFLELRELPKRGFRGQRGNK